MQTNSYFIPQHLIRNRRYQAELQVRQEQELEDAKQEQVRHDFIRSAPDINHLMYIARSIAF